MKKYISANIAIVRMHGNIIATSLGATDTTEIDRNYPWDAPSRREHRTYGNNYSDDYNNNYGL